MTNQTSRKNKISSKPFFIILIVFLMVAIIGTSIYVYQILNKESFYKGIFVDGISLENMNKKEAINKIDEKNQPDLDKIQIILKHEGKQWKYDYKDIAAQVDSEDIVDKAYAIGREGNIIERLKEIYGTSKSFKIYETTLSYDVSLIDKDIKNIAREIHEEAIDATIEFQPENREKFIFTAEKTGRGMLIEKTIKDINAKVDANDFSVYKISMEQLNPKYKLDEVETWTSRLAYYSTSLDGNDNRNHNIKLSSAAYNNIRLDPGQEYSMNNATGPRGKTEGYRSASVIKQGKKFEDEPGGGNCQTSTTLYGAVMRADLEILNRLAHSIKSSYTDIGTDAMVDYPWADFKFKNNNDTPIFITRYISGGKLHVEVYGKPSDEFDEIKIVSKKISESKLPEYKIIEDPNLLEGNEIIDWRSRPEIKAESYRVYYKNGEEIKRVKEANSIYPKTVGQKRVGTKRKPMEEPKTPLKEDEPKEDVQEELDLED